MNLRTDYWMALYSKPNSEKKLASQLEALNVEHYCPLQKTERQWSDRRKIVEIPVFKSYVFVKPTADQVWMLIDLPNVVNYVYWCGKPAQIRHHEIETIRMFLGEHPDARFERTDVPTGATVRIRSGVLMDLTGVVEQVRQQTVSVRIDSLGGTLVAELRKDNIALAV
jgi:transcription antitermination factor NusG